MRRALAVCLLACAASSAAAQQQDFSKVEVKSEPAAGKVSMLTGAGGNIGVSVGDDGILIVDDQYAPLADKIRAALKGLGDGKLKFIVNTHFHGDHTGGNEVFGPEAPIIAHSNVRKRLATPQNILGNPVPAAAAKALPIITFDQSLSIYFNGEEIKAIHFPHGHTDGDSVLIFTGSNVVHMGDDFFNGMFPFVDIGNGGSVQGMADGVAKVLALVPAGAKVIPGHGPLSDVDGLKRFHRMLVVSMDTVGREIKAGKSLEQIQKAGLPAEWKSWSGSFINTDKWLETVYQSLKGIKPQGAPPPHH